jgi:excinuclease ABC subunit B
MKRAILAIREELGTRIAEFERDGKLLEAQRIKMRTEYDLEMMEEMGFCSGDRELFASHRQSPARLAARHGD